jgi:hypothetical protein
VVSTTESSSRSLAHYYVYSQIYHGKTLVRDAAVPLGFSYSGAPLVLDAGGVWPMVDNPATAELPQTAEYLANEFDYTYSGLLSVLHEVFNGRPDGLNEAMGMMYSLRVIAQKLLAIPMGPGVEGNAGPRFRHSERLRGPA